VVGDRSDGGEAGATKVGLLEGPVSGLRVPCVSGVPSAPPDASGLRALPADVGQVLDEKYELLSRLDEGGMGAVFVAHNLALDVQVAVKVVRADLREADEDDTLLVDRLLQEARAAARLGHPAIVRTFDFGKAKNGDPYLVMELLDGTDLATTLVTRGRIRPNKAVRLLLPVGHALAAAHEQGIVHRDLKPENIVIAREHDGRIQPKLIDFGVAKLHQANVRRLTAAGRAVGTPGYMSPEQARGEDVDARADIWAFCVVLYEAMTGKLPFEGSTCQGLLRSILEDAPAPLSERGVEDAALWAVISRGLHKNPDARWPTMRALGRALAQWLLDQDIPDDICGSSLRVLWLQDAPSRRSQDILASVPPPSNLMPDFPPSGDAIMAARAPTEMARKVPSLYEGPAIEPSADEPSRAPRAVRATPGSERIPGASQREGPAPPPSGVSPAPASARVRAEGKRWRIALVVAAIALVALVLFWRLASC